MHILMITVSAACYLSTTIRIQWLDTERGHLDAQQIRPFLVCLMNNRQREEKAGKWNKNLRMICQHQRFPLSYTFVQ
jgi:hypothetical protein